jgi:hypothetical protein
MSRPPHKSVDSRSLSLMERRRLYEQHFSSLSTGAQPPKAQTDPLVQIPSDMPIATRYGRPLDLSDDSLGFMMRLRDQDVPPPPQNRDWLGSLDSEAAPPKPIIIPTSARLLFHKGAEGQPPVSLISQRPAHKIVQPKGGQNRRQPRPGVPPVLSTRPDQKSDTGLGDPIRAAIPDRARKGSPIGDLIQGALGPPGKRDEEDLPPDFDEEGGGFVEEEEEEEQKENEEDQKVDDQRGDDDDDQKEGATNDNDQKAEDDENWDHMSDPDNDGDDQNRDDQLEPAKQDREDEPVGSVEGDGVTAAEGSVGFAGGSHMRMVESLGDLVPQARALRFSDVFDSSVPPS